MFPSVRQTNLTKKWFFFAIFGFPFPCERNYFTVLWIFSRFSVKKRISLNENIKKTFNLNEIEEKSKCIEKVTENTGKYDVNVLALAYRCAFYSNINVKTLTIGLYVDFIISTSAIRLVFLFANQRWVKVASELFGFVRS